MANRRYLELERALHAIASACDGALKLDHQGFNAHDTRFGRVMSRIDVQSWTLKQAIAVHNLLRKYRRQLSEDHGIDYAAIPLPLAHCNAHRTRNQPRPGLEADRQLRLPYMRLEVFNGC